MSGIVHISEAASLAFHTLILLAEDPKRPLRVNQATQRLPVSKNHLAKVMQRLSRAGLVSSTRGPTGGFVLAKEPEQITLLEVYEAVEGPIHSQQCLLGRPACSGSCVFGDFITRTTAEFRTMLRETRLCDVAGALRRRGTA